MTISMIRTQRRSSTEGTLLVTSSVPLLDGWPRSSIVDGISVPALLLWNVPRDLRSQFLSTSSCRNLWLDKMLWHWFSLMGICFPLPMNRLCHLHVENFARRQPPFDHSQSDSGDFSGRKMDAKKIVDHPIDM